MRICSYPEITARLKSAMFYRNIRSTRQLAKAIGLPHSTAVRYLNGDTEKGDLSIIFQILLWLNVDEDAYSIDGTDTLRKITDCILTDKSLDQYGKLAIIEVFHTSFRLMSGAPDKA